ncbi:MAG TPA: hypothetical protein DEF51_49800, partial [Myxococcales bacterium]|nr:hypothetical protein [Myxococcales bacterium]
MQLCAAELLVALIGAGGWMSRHGMAIGLALWALAHAAPCAAQEMTTTQREEARGLFEAGRAA